MRAENIVNCPSCGASLVAGLRFCRMCGYRLGEGVEEFVATQRFDAASMPTAPAAPPATDPFQARQTWGAAPMQPFGAPGAIQQPQGVTSKLAKACRPARGGWWLWVIIGLVILIAGGTAPIWMGARSNPGAPPPLKSFLGVDGLETAPGGGAFLTGISGPETPMLRAKLVGGDIIKTFDGKEVRNADDLRRILGETPVGKTVEVGFIRDGVFGTTQLTTIAQRDSPGRRPFDERPGGAGNIEINMRDLDRVQLPTLNIFGVELGKIDRNGPADIAGLRSGDIIIKFGEYPIRTAGDLRYRIYEALPGTTVPVTVVRGAEQIEIQDKIGRSKD
jgi:membrane-associated protease RseP (regulator of RpoE activity)